MELESTLRPTAHDRPSGTSLDRRRSEQLYRRGRVAIKLGRYADARRIFDMLATTDGVDARFVSHRGLLLALAERRINESVIMCKHAITLAPTEPLLHVNLARVFCSLGQRDAAVVTLRRAIRAQVASKELVSLLERLSPRARPPIAALDRNHVLNSVLGKLRARLPGGKSCRAANRRARRPA